MEINETNASVYPSLKAIAAVLDLASVQRLYNVAKTPIPGETYDPKVINKAAIEQFINRQLVKNADDLPFDTADEVLVAALQWDEQNPTTSRAGGARTPKTDTGISKRRFEQWEMMTAEGAFKDHLPLVILRNDPYVYAIVYQTISHSVMRPVIPACDGYEEMLGTPEGATHETVLPTYENKDVLAEDYDSYLMKFLGESVRTISNSVLNLKGLGPTDMRKLAIDRWSKHEWDVPAAPKEPKESKN